MLSEVYVTGNLNQELWELLLENGLLFPYLTLK